MGILNDVERDDDLEAFKKMGEDQGPPTVAGGKTMSDDQARALDEIEAWLEGKGVLSQYEDAEWARTLRGFAGTGKTTLVQALAARADGLVAFTAPTNKATKVLRKMAERQGLGGVDCLTIHKMLSLTMGSDDEEKYLVQADAGGGKIGDYGLIVVDEASMVGSALFSRVESAAKAYRVPVLFVGDPMQLPPVKDGEAKAFELAGPRLERIVRQAEGNPIIRLTGWVRDVIAGRQADEPPTSADGVDGVHVVSPGDFLRVAVEGLAAAWREGREAKGIAWRNVTVDAINDAVRHELHGRNPPDWIVGERVIAASPCAGEVLYTDQESTIVEIREEAHHDFPQFASYYLALDTEDAGRDVVPVVHPKAYRALHEELDRRAAEAKSLRTQADRQEGTNEGRRLRQRSGMAWRSFWQLKDAFADLRHCHAITAHRSQGSTYDEVFVDAGDVMANRDRKEALRCLYVAISRASRNVWMKEV